MLRMLLPAILTLTAGFVAGVAWQNYRTVDASSQGLDVDLESYRLGLVDLLELDKEQGRNLRLLLYYYQQERDDLFSRSLARVDDEWLELDQRFESLVLARILDSKQRQQFADLRQPQQLDFTTLQR